MGSVRPLRVYDDEEPPALHERAMDNLRFIRETMESATSFTAVSGWGMIVVGVMALTATVIAGRQTSSEAWLLTWIGAAALALPVAVWSNARKAWAARMSLLAGPARKCALGFFPAVVAGALLTVTLYRADLMVAIPGTWLMLYGVGIVAGGVLSVRILPVMGSCFMAAGAAAVLTPAAWDLWWMAAGFGGLHLLFGAVIVRKYGG